MRNVTILFPVLCLLFLGCSTTAVTFPEPRGYINDHAGVMKISDVQKLESMITRLKQETGAELAFLILQTVKPSDIDSYTDELMDRWKVGDAMKNNGVLVVVAIKDRQWAARIGYGLERELSDSFVEQMGHEHLSGPFKLQKYSEGLVNFSAVILGVLSMKYDVRLMGDPNNDEALLERGIAKCQSALRFYNLLEPRIAGRAKMSPPELREFQRDVDKVYKYFRAGMRDIENSRGQAEVTPWIKAIRELRMILNELK